MPPRFTPLRRQSANQECGRAQLEPAETQALRNVKVRTFAIMGRREPKITALRFVIRFFSRRTDRPERYRQGEPIKEKTIGDDSC